MKPENKKAMFAALTALAVLFAGAAVVSAAPGSIDSDASDTENITYVSENETISTSFNGSMGAEEKYGVPVLNATGASADDLAMNVSHENVTYYEFTGEWDTYASGESDTSTDYIHNFTDSDLDRVPVDPSENVTLEVTYWNESADNPSPTTITVFVETTDERNVQRVTENASFAEVQTSSPPIYRPLSDDYSVVDVDDDAAINGSNTTVIYTLDSEAVQNPFNNRTESLSSGAFTLMEADATGDSSEDVPVFLNSVPDWYDSEDMGTYAVVNPSENTLEMNPSAENFDGENTMEVSATSDVYRVTDVYQVYKLAGGYSGSGLDAVMNMVM